MTLHSRIIFLLKIAIPSIIALFIGTIIIIPQIDNRINTIEIGLPTLDTENNISFTMDNGSFYGEGQDGTIFSINIENFQEDKSDMNMFFNEIQAKIFLKNTNWIEIATQKGTYKNNNKLFIMKGDIIINDNDNNTMLTDEATLDTNKISISGDKEINANTTFGNINAEGFHFIKDDKYIFKGKIKGTINTSKIEK